jgi:hypothetical protein
VGQPQTVIDGPFMSVAALKNLTAAVEVPAIRHPASINDEAVNKVRVPACRPQLH